ncbi:MAG: 3-oxoacyl-ACP synthase III [Desulfobacterales bacterium]|nr:3-oxoacyl-ACP synthase III [Desulfobacterales bacterium]
MKYNNVFIDTIQYEIAPNSVTSLELEERLKPFYKKFGFKQGQLESLTGVRERRYWDEVHTMHEGASKAGIKAIEASGISPSDIGMVIYGGVCRDNHEPATACSIAHTLGVDEDAQVYDVSNACIGVLTGVLQVANAIESGQIKAGLVLSCESAKQIVDSTINLINQNMDLEFYKKTIATLTGGAGAVAVLLTAKNFQTKTQRRHQLLTSTLKNSVEHHELCRWGHDKYGMPTESNYVMETDAQLVLKYGVDLAIKTFDKMLNELSVSRPALNKVICHQVGSIHRAAILDALGIEKNKDFNTFQYLGNMGTVSLPMTAQLADEYNFIHENDLVGFLGIGSGLNCLMLGVKW